MIVRDEAGCLAECLASVTPIADEIIVVDTGSTDLSQEIAKSYGARVLSYRWNDDFAAARNASLEAATGDWILVIDADECLAMESIPVLRDFLSARLAPACIKIRNVCFDSLGRITKTYTLVRLFANLPSLRFTQPFHEYLQDSGDPALPQIFRPDLVLIHSGYELAVTRSKGKATRDRMILDKLRQQQPGYPLWLYYSANQHSVSHQTELALSEYLQLLSQSELADQAYFHRAVIETLRTCVELQRLSQGLRIADFFEDICRNIPDYWYLRGVLCRRHRDLSQAIICFENCLNFQTQEQFLQCQYSPLYLNEGPLLQILQIHRSQLHHPALNIAQHQSAWQAYWQTIWRCLHASGALLLPGIPDIFSELQQPFGPFWLLHLAEAQAMSVHLFPESNQMQMPNQNEQDATKMVLANLVIACVRLVETDFSLPLAEILKSWAAGENPKALNQLADTSNRMMARLKPVFHQEPGLLEAFQRHISWLVMHICLVQQRHAGWALLHAQWWLEQDEHLSSRQVILQALMILPQNPVLLATFAQAEANTSTVTTDGTMAL